MNQYKVDKKKFIAVCKKAIKNLEIEHRESENRGHFVVANEVVARKKEIMNTLKITEMAFVSEIIVSESFLNTLNYCLTNQ